MDFRSDNIAGAHPRVIEALARANAGNASAYGGDELSQAVEARLAALFERPVRVFPVATGTAANALALSACAPPYGAVVCHRLAHIANDECGAPEFYAGGAKLVPLAGAYGKLDAGEVEATLARIGPGRPHNVPPAAVSLSQASELGTAYRADEIGRIAEVCRRRGLKLHVDGARFANAVVALNASPAELTWRAGVDLLSFGVTKNGAIAAEAVVVFDAELGRDLDYRRKRAGQLFSKQRFAAAQWLAMLEGDLWRDCAAHANAMARRLGEGLAALPGLRLAAPVEANEVFALLPEAVVRGLEAEGAKFHRWAAGAADGLACIRLVTAWNTEAADVARFLAAAAKAPVPSRA